MLQAILVLGTWKALEQESGLISGVKEVGLDEAEDGHQDHLRWVELYVGRSCIV